MLRRFVVLALLWLVAAPAFSQPAAEMVPAPVRVRLETGAGPIVLELDAPKAPITTANFLRYVDQKRFDGVVFYRAMRLTWGDQPNGLIQAGTQNDPRRLLPPIAHEPTDATGIRHKAGTVSMARYAPGTATGDFSILLSDMPGLDADPNAAPPDRRAGFAAFGHVVSGMDTVRAIFAAPVSSTKGEGVMKGQMLEPTIRILTARRVPATVHGAHIDNHAP